MRVFLLFLGAVLGLAGCAGLGVDDVYRAPTFSHQSSQLTALSWQQLNGRSRILINNPNAYSLPIRSLQAELWLEGEPWLQLDSPAINGLAAGSTTTLELDWSLAVSGLVERLGDAYDTGEAALTLHLSPVLAVPVLGDRPLQWQHDFVMPVPKLPQIRLADWRVDSVGLTSLTLELDLLLDNPNRFGLATGPLELNLTKGGSAVSGIRLAPLALAASAKQIQSTRLTLNYGDLGMTLARALNDGGWPADLGLSWRAPISSPDLGLDLPALAGEVVL